MSVSETISFTFVVYVTKNHCMCLNFQCPVYCSIIALPPSPPIQPIPEIAFTPGDTSESSGHAKEESQSDSSAVSLLVQGYSSEGSVSWYYYSYGIHGLACDPCLDADKHVDTTNCAE